MKDSPRFGIHIRYSADGQIEAFHRNRGPAPPGYPITLDELRDASLVNELQREPRKFMAQNGQILPKPVVVIEFDKHTISCDAEDCCAVRLRNVPESYARTKLRVGSQELYLPRDEPLEINCDTAQALEVELLEPRLWAKPRTILVQRDADAS